MEYIIYIELPQKLEVNQDTNQTKNWQNWTKFIRAQ